ncbi:putative 3-demethylubiquinone-9 3-methyltransferase [Viridothelium virens]|uniref:Putative 3-demethylubiquinone-9 3-methyltransferase n=1 Tax=Viridothelium virens TaxID=1048519 RepID=A0A6A6GW55_VIRVR|nr:putative 3-demethylubiquinone-9 3-methyltransferase [Viridothelium virens]
MSIETNIKPSLWFAGNAEEAVHFYTSIFPSSKITDVSRYTAAGQEEHQMEVGSVMSMEFILHHRPFFAINGPPVFQFTQAISFTISCEDQKDVDYYWGKLSEGGEPGPCGWLKDKFGISWRVIPKAYEEMMGSRDVEQRFRVSEAKSTMGKFDIEGLRKAFEGK